MAFTTINTSDTLEQMRVKLNNLTTNDFGNPSLLTAAGLSSTSIVGAVVEIAGVAFSAAGFTVRDANSPTPNIQVIGAGQTLDVLGAANQITAVVSSPDTLTLGLTNNVSITGNFTASGALHTLGTVEISGNIIRSVNTSLITVNDSLTVSTGDFKVTDGAGTLTIGDTDSSYITHSANIIRFGATSLVTDGFFYTRSTTGFIFEGVTDDNNETILTCVDPSTDRVITFPDITGTVITSGDTGTVTNSMLAGSISNTKFADGAITEVKIADNAVASAKLKSVVNLQILNSAGGILKSIYGAGV